LIQCFHAPASRHAKSVGKSRTHHAWIVGARQAIAASALSASEVKAFDLGKYVCWQCFAKWTSPRGRGDWVFPRPDLSIQTNALRAPFAGQEYSTAVVGNVNSSS
jgi:hypothetical protein